MKNEQILKKAIEKAVENGFDKRKTPGRFAHELFGDGIWGKVIDTGYYFQWIFSHDWAKAFIESLTMGQRQQILDRADLPMSWANDMERVKDCFLQEMIVKEQPLKYIEKFLK